MADESQQADTPNEMKKKFRDALERKNSQASTGESHTDGQSKAKGPSNGAARKRTFRRKTG